MTKIFGFFQYLHNAQIKGSTVWFYVMSVIFFSSLAYGVIYLDCFGEGCRVLEG